MMRLQWALASLTVRPFPPSASSTAKSSRAQNCMEAATCCHASTRILPPRHAEASQRLQQPFDTPSPPLQRWAHPGYALLTWRTRCWCACALTSLATRVP